MLLRFVRNEDGATAIEYGLIATLISVAIVGGFSQFADALQALWSDSSSVIVEVLTR